MNKIYNVIWNRELGRHVVTSELATRRSKSKTVRAASMVLSCLLTAPALALFSMPAAAYVAGDGAVQGAAGNTVVGDGASGYVTCGVTLNVGPGPDGTPSPLGDCLNSTAVGTGATTSAGATTAVGEQANASAQAATAIGALSQAGQYSTAVGADAVATGGWAVALGQGAHATGIDSSAVGTNAWATATRSAAIGSGAHATADDAMAIGRVAVASGLGSFALGTATETTGIRATGIGNNAVASGVDSIALGTQTNSGGLETIAAGRAAQAHTDYSIVMGSEAGMDSTDTGPQAIYIGKGAGSQTVGTGTVGGNVGIGSYALVGSEASRTVALGYGAGQHTTGSQNVFIGSGSVLTGTGTGANTVGQQNIAIGSSLTGMNVTGDNNIAFGTGAGSDITASDTIAIGTSSSASQADAVALGSNSVANTAGGIAGYVPVGADAAHMAGITATTSTLGAVSVGDAASGQFRQVTGVAAGTEDSDAVNVAQLSAVADTASDEIDAAKTHYYSVNDNGVQGSNYNNDGATGINALAAGIGATAIGDKGTALGNASMATGELSTAVGVAANAMAKNSTALGSGSLANQENATALGSEASATARSATAVGPAASAGGEQANAMGYFASAQGASSVAIGALARAADTGTIGLGSNSSAAGIDSIAIGRGANTHTNNAIAIGADAGANSTTTGIQTIYIGNGAGSNMTESNTTGGNVGIGASALAGSQSYGSVALGYGVAQNTQGFNNISVGNGSVDTGTGTGGGTVGHDNVAIGTGAAGADVTGDNNVALGMGAGRGVTASKTVALGMYGIASADEAAAIGMQATASAMGGVALGSRSVADRESLVTGYVPVGADATQQAAITATRSTLGAVSVGDAAGNKFRQITGVAAGSEDSDAVNVAQLSAVADTANSGWNISAQGANSTNVAPGSSVDMANTDGNIVISKTADNNDVNFDLGSDINIDNSITVGGTTINGDSITTNNLTVSGDTQLGDNFFIDNSGAHYDGPITEGDNIVNKNYVDNSVNENKTRYYSVNDNGVQGGNYDNDGATGINALAAGVNASASVDDGIALGSNSAANTAGGIAGYIPTGADAAQLAAITATTSTLGAVSVGDAASGQFRQITGVAAGTENSDAVNVAQLKAVGDATSDEIDAAKTHYYSVNDNGVQGGNYNNDGATGINALAAGVNASASVDNGIALGSNSVANTAGGIAGYIPSNADAAQLASINATTSTLGALSVGDVASGQFRQITGVAAGTEDSDATNVAQLKAVAAAASDDINAAKTHYYSVNDNGVQGGNYDNDGATGINALAAGVNAHASVEGGIAMGSSSVSNRAAGLASYVPASASDGQRAAIAATTSTQGAFSIGDADAGIFRQITGVAAGTMDSDAVNVAQLKAVSAAAEAGAVHYYSVNDNGVQGANYDNTGATGTNAMAAGVAATAAGEAAVAMGNEAQANAGNSVAVGNGANASAEGGVALGGGSVADREAGTAGYVPASASDAQQAAIAATTSTDGAVSVGDAANGKFRQITGVAAGSEDSDAVNVAQLKAAGEATSDEIEASKTHYYSVNDGGKQSANYNNDGATGNNAIAAGTNASAAGSSAVAMGDGAQAAAASSVAIGNNAKATTSNSVALGSNSVASRDNSVSVGTAGNERQITNVAAGTADTDAVNVSQLEKSTGDINNRIDNTYNSLRHDLKDQDDTLSAGIAGAMAAAALPQPYSPGASMVSAGAGNYRGQSSLAIGVSTISDNGKWVSKLAGTADSQGEFGVSVGVGYQW